MTTSNPNGQAVREASGRLIGTLSGGGGVLYHLINSYLINAPAEGTPSGAIQNVYRLGRGEPFIISVAVVEREYMKFLNALSAMVDADGRGNSYFQIAGHDRPLSATISYRLERSKSY